MPGPRRFFWSKHLHGAVAVLSGIGTNYVIGSIYPGDLSYLVRRLARPDYSRAHTNPTRKRGKPLTIPRLRVGLVWDTNR